MLRDVSVVIPTIGEKKIFRTVYLLNKIDYLKPACIIISVYFGNYEKIKSLKKKYNNIVIVKTIKKSQVFQRIAGFKKCKTKFALQLDADCLISSKNILKLKNKLVILGNMSSISPVFLNIENGKTLHELRTSFFNFIKDKILGFKNGVYKMGQVTNGCLNFGVDRKFMITNILKTEWQPGGCILHYRKNLIKKNYYPFSGKSYCEDLIHSKILINNKISLFVFKLAVCKTDKPIFPKKKNEIKKFLIAFNYLKKYYLDYSKVRFLISKLIYKIRLIIANDNWNIK